MRQSMQIKIESSEICISLVIFSVPNRMQYLHCIVPATGHRDVVYLTLKYVILLLKVRKILFIGGAQCTGCVSMFDEHTPARWVSHKT